VRIAYFGTSQFAVEPLQTLVSQHQNVVVVVTQPDRPAGRGGKLTASPVKDTALTLALPVVQPESCRDPVFQETLTAYQPDLIVVAAYGQFLPTSLLALPPCGPVNLHGSLLPRYRGAAPIQRAIWNGEATTGVSLMWMVREMDAGDVIAQVDTPITAEDTAGTLSQRLAHLGSTLLLDWLPALARRDAPHHPQNPTEITFAPPIRNEERAIDWTAPALTLWRQIRALAPAPVAVTTFRGELVKFLVVQPAPTHTSATPGSLLPESAPRLLVATGDGVLEILTLQPAGKRPMTGADFLRGARPAAHEKFGI